MDRMRVWLAVSPLIAGGVLSAHALAYRLTDTGAGSLHAYLDHAPQVLVVVALVAVVVAGTAACLSSPAAWPFPIAAVVTFVAQEHVERLAHTGELPWLLTSPTFLVGLLLQVPVAFVIWSVARLLLGALVPPRVRRPTLPRVLFGLVAKPAGIAPSVTVALPRGRGPPLLHRL